MTELSKEKRAVAVALSLPEDDKRKIKEKVFGELELDVLKSENGMSVLFEFLDRYLLEDELMNSWNKFEDFEKFERKYGQNIREYVADFDLKFRKLEKIHVKLPSEILAFKLLRNANLSKQERMLVFTGVNFAEKENMYQQTKHSLIKFMGDLTEEEARMGSNVRLEPGWKKLVSCSYKKGSVEHGSNGVMKKKLNPLGLNGQILLCKSCGSYRHFVADCPDSWENMMKGKASKGSMKSNDRSNNEKIMGKTGLRGETKSNVSHYGNGLDSVDVEELVVEVIRLKKDKGIIKDEIFEIKAENNELKRQKEELKGYVENLEQKKERLATQYRSTMQENNKKILKFQEERKDSLELMKNCQDGETESENLKELRLLSGQLGKQIKKQWDRKESKEEINIKGEMFRNIYERQVRENETAVKGKLQQSNGTKMTKQRFLEKAKIVKQKLQMNKGYKKGTWRKESLIQQLHDAILRINEWNQTRMWGWRSEDSQQLNDMTLQLITGNWFSKL